VSIHDKSASIHDKSASIHHKSASVNKGKWRARICLYVTPIFWKKKVIHLGWLQRLKIKG